MPTTASHSSSMASSSSRMRSVMRSARILMRAPVTPIDRQPIFTSGGARSRVVGDCVRSHSIVFEERLSSWSISGWVRPFFLSSRAFWTRASIPVVMGIAVSSARAYKYAPAGPLAPAYGSGHSKARGEETARACGHHAVGAALFERLSKGAGLVRGKVARECREEFEAGPAGLCDRLRRGVGGAGKEEAGGKRFDEGGAPGREREGKGAGQPHVGARGGEGLRRRGVGRGDQRFSKQGVGAKRQHEFLDEHRRALLEVDDEGGRVAQDREGLVQRRDFAPAVRGREPRARVEAAQLVEGLQGDGPPPVGRPVQGRVVEEHEAAVLGCPDIELDEVAAEFDGVGKRDDRVLGERVRRAAVGGDAACHETPPHGRAPAGSISTSTSPAAATCPAAVWIPTTRPAGGDTTSFCIFTAWSGGRGSPRSTKPPTATGTDMTRP